MARKLQSDKWLFLATLALICASVVMVYSASALVALERFQQPYLFVTRQLMWACVGIAVLSIVMRIDYRTYKNDKLIWAGLGLDRHPELLSSYFGNYTKVIYLAQTHDEQLVENGRKAAERLGLAYEYRFTGYGELESDMKARA